MQQIQWKVTSIIYGKDVIYQRLVTCCYDVCRNVRKSIGNKCDLDTISFVAGALVLELTRTIEHYTEANKKYLNNFDPSKSPTLVTYFDVHNQYGYVLSELRLRFNGLKIQICYWQFYQNLLRW